ncbi:Thioredoxin reductase [Poriferisphaera corsica]|uniref:Thioredoxin reductase n=1 Tax=Poriferisphaera corsica TaxID=2528020 RepID=A0A517YY30_9BACT|nr:thioredoxin-disulfide reductase [Poriferisphaera corsica]QDU35109.1 Thioredoxin reductase [Poriferisphaera corsica]
MSEENNEIVEKVVIIGSGPAGWTAAIYAARANLNPVVFPGRAAGKDLLPGGQLMLTTDVENFPGFPKGVMGPEMMQQFFDQAMRFGTRVVTDKGIKDESGIEMGLYTPFQNVAEVDLSKRPFVVKGDGGVTIKAEAVIIATGAKANWLGLDNELRLAQTGGGVSACAVCDGALPMFRDKELAVVGGGDSAVEEASYLTKFASKVYMVVRRDELRASKIMADRAKNNPKIEILWNTRVVDVHGDEKITGVKLESTKTGEQRELDLTGLFMAIGHTPITDFLDGQLETDETGFLKLTDPYRSYTSIEGVFAAGDVADHVYKQAITAAGMGCKAAIDAERWLAEQGIA